MARIEKTVFISYRRTDVYTALAVYENLKNQGYDVFFDYRSISSGDFEQIITSNIRARAHFLLILTPTALDRCSEPGDWLRREIEIAIEEKRNIVPLFFKGFRFGAPEVSKQLTGKLQNISRYNGLNVHEDYFEEAMQRVRTQFLSIPLDTVLHPVSTEVLKAVKAEQVAADKALEQIEDVKELAKQSEEKPDPPPPAPAPTPDPKEAELERLKKQATRHELMGEFWDALQVYYQIKKLDPLFPGLDLKIRQLEKETQPVPAPPMMTSRVPTKSATRNAPISSRLIAIGIAALLVVILCVWGGVSLWNNLASTTPEPTQTSQQQQVVTPTFQATATSTRESSKTSTPAPTKTSIHPTPTLGIGSTMTGKDGMTLLYVPAGPFEMGSEDGSSDEKPVHTVSLNAFWIDQTEVTNAMYAKCVTDGQCDPLSSIRSYTRDSYYGNSEFDNYPVIYVSWDDANKYCSWADRRLPTEAEWEKAARGTDGNIYPWGDAAPNNNLLNYNSAVGDTTEVDKYPNGVSLYGAYDMAGNVWEWVDDWYDAYPGNTDSNSAYGTTYRVLRGGAWDGLDLLVRSAYRYWSDPAFTYSLVGFRCSRSP
jgi:formylglycine-generating enzyme required for sulfatase activity